MRASDGMRTFARYAAATAAMGVLAVVFLVGGSAAALKPSVVLTNDANNDGIFTVAENVAKNANGSVTVPFQLTLDAGSFGPHTVVSVTDTATNTPICANLIGSIPVNGTRTCTFDVTVTVPSSSTFVESIDVVWDRAGGDTAQAVSTVDFPALTLTKSSTTTLVTSAGQSVGYTYVVTNSGTSAVTGIDLSDDNTDAQPDCSGVTALAPGDSMTCTATHLVTAGDLGATSLVNHATASSNEAADAAAMLSIPIEPIAIGGAFVVGDISAGSLAQGTSLFFWGAQWWKNNVLSGGTGPAAFKGFEDSPAVPICGVPWTSRPGNSTPPPATIPQYMAIIVSSTITKSGSSITGDIQHVVLVQTNAGYAGNPGHAGTGVIVGTIC